MNGRIVKALAVAAALTVGLNAAPRAAWGYGQKIDAVSAGRSSAWPVAADFASQAIESGQQGRTLPGRMTVGGMSVGGLEADDAIAKVRMRIEEALNGTVTLKSPRAGDGAKRDSQAGAPSWRELGLWLDAAGALRAIERYRDASWLNKRAARRLLDKDWPVEAHWDEDAFAEKAEALWGELADKRPVDAVRTIDAGDRVVYIAESAGETLDIAALLSVLKKRAPASLAGRGQAQPGAADAPLRLDIPLPVVPVKPDITTASLKAEGITRKIAEFSTSFTTSGEGRSHNVTATANALDGILLEPGGTFDYGAVVAQARQKFGYRAAPVIMKGKLVPGVGGGICQVSSTLYNAVLRASDLTIIERRNHSLPVNYLPQGTDATFAEGYINFRFRNDTGKRLLIKTAVRGKRLTVKLFGTMPGNVRYALETVREREIAPRIAYVSDPGLAVGMTRLVQQGKAGAVVDTYRLKYVDGKLAERRKLDRSTYRAQDGIVAVHPADSRLGGSPAPAPAPAPERQGQTPAEPM